MTPEGRTYAIQRLIDAPDLAALRYLWEVKFSDYTKRDPAVKDFKDKMKRAMGG